VLLLGDSFSNVYSDRAAFARGAGLDWGSGAGLAEQLSFALGRPVDRIVRNDDGAFATRRELAAELARAAARGRDRLAGVRAVVWQFAERELAFGDWRPVELVAAPAGAHAPSPAPAPAAQAAERRTVRGTVAARAPLPDPGSTPYPDALFAVRLVDVVGVGEAPGAAAPTELVVYLQGLRGSRRTQAAGLRRGERVEVDIVGFGDEAAQARYGGLARTELDDDAALLLPAFWGEVRR
jgi:alginate O-acetyltransferase complex protein AlgJ